MPPEELVNAVSIDPTPQRYFAGDKRAQQMANELRARLLTELGKKGKGGDG